MLADKDIVAAVYEALSTTASQKPSSSASTAGWPDMVLRLLILKHIRNWSFEVLERDVKGCLRSYGRRQLPEVCLLTK